jgi:hypothetical protein
VILEHFELLLTEAGLNHYQASKDYGVAFTVSLHVALEFGTRYQSAWLCYERTEFAEMTRDAAQCEIAECKKQLERAASTQQGVITQGRTAKPVPPQKNVVRQRATVNYPVH